MTLEEAVSDLKVQLRSPNLVITASEEDADYFYLWITVEGKPKRFLVKKK